LGDADKYIDPQMKQAAIDADPVVKLRRYLIDHKVATEAQLTAIETAIEERIDEAVEFGLKSPYPDESEMTKDVFAPEVI
jgi:pyruvate dehydrogenase E1 component alpha subunit